MKLATLRNGQRDGRLAVVSRDLSSAIWAPVPTMLDLIEEWNQHVDTLQALYERLNARDVDCFAFVPAQAMAPLPRSFQWLDASAFLAHGALMAKALKLTKNVQEDFPLIYQGGSDTLLGACEDVAFPSADLGIDLEGEFGVILDEVPMGATKAEAASSIRLIMLVNDWSLRMLAPREMATGFGWLQSKPSSSFSPVAVTPEELGPAWKDCRVHLPLELQVNGKFFGKPFGGTMNYGFDELIQHAARTRKLSVGTIFGSGTVSEGDPPRVGSACIAEIRGYEMIHDGEPKTDFLSYGDRVHITVHDPSGHEIFGALDQIVVPAPRQEI